MEKFDVINPKLIFLDIEMKNKEEIIKFIAEKAKLEGYINDTKVFYDSVMKREGEFPTSTGYDIAIPHGKTETVKHPFICFFRSKEKFIWTEGVEDEVRGIFQIGVPEIGTELLHLKLISQLSKKLLDDDFREKLFKLNDKNTVYELLNSVEV